MWHTWITIFGFAFVFMMTVAGASVVYFFKGPISPKVSVFFLGFASGVMLAASIWSLLLPAIEQAKSAYGKFSFIPAVIGFLSGGVFLTFLDKMASHFYPTESLYVKCARLFFAVTAHNIPEGLAVGFAFGVVTIGDDVALLSALLLAVGIGVQNFPEGVALSLPLNSALKNTHKAFAWGAMSGVVEPLFATVGYFLASTLRYAQPWILAFSAGAMVFVVAQDLIPDTKSENYPRLGAWWVLVGFTLMMTLDVALGS